MIPINVGELHLSRRSILVRELSGSPGILDYEHSTIHPKGKSSVSFLLNISDHLLGSGFISEVIHTTRLKLWWQLDLRV